jgi:hypothetical protein
MTETAERRFNSFTEFYPYYLSQHQNRICRRLHLFGLLLGVLSGATFLLVGHPGLLMVSLVIGYGCGWTGHFVFEKNRPATYGHPLYSFLGDFRMVADILAGRISI